MAYKQEPGRGKSTPLKMAGEKMKSTSPIMKALVGNQDKLPEHLKKKILDAPEDSPVKMYGSPVKMEGDKGPLKMYKSPVKMNGGPGDDDDDDDDDKKKEKKINDVTFTEEGFNTLFEKDIPKPGVRAPKRNYARAHASGMSAEKRAENLQKRYEAGRISEEKFKSMMKRMR